ncbi:MAG: hypothetical protein AAFW60_07935, partial [Pseudomonadota bacterium]
DNFIYWRTRTFAQGDHFTHALCTGGEPSLTRYVPLLPLVGISASIAAFSGSVLMIELPPPSLASPNPPLPIEFDDANGSGARLLYNDPIRLNGDAQIVLLNSPFSKSRTAFTRARMVPERDTFVQPNVQLEPKLFGVTETNRTPRALVSWRPGEDATQIEVGDETPLGKVVAISSNEVQFEKEGRSHSLTLF